MPSVPRNTQPVRVSTKPSVIDMPLITVPTQEITEMDMRLGVGAPDQVGMRG